jgi:phytoene dehydrogenase-like protein
VHPLGLGSPFFNSLPLAGHGLRWIQPPLCVAHPLDDAPAATISRDLESTAKSLGPDADAYRSLFEPLARGWDSLTRSLLGPLTNAADPLLLARFGFLAMQSAERLARSRFETERGRALFAGLAAHSVLPLDRVPSSAIALMLGAAAHAVGWPIAAGGSRTIANALVAHLRTLGGEVITDSPVTSLGELSDYSPILLDITPKQLLELACDSLPRAAQRALEAFEYGPGVCKVDWMIEGQIPWKDKACALAGTVHLGGSLQEIVAAEAAPWRGQHAERPFVLLAQPGMFDASRAPAGIQPVWAYCHVPAGSDLDVSERIAAQVERFAPGFRNLITGQHVRTARAMESYNPNLVGGDIGGGANTFSQLLRRPLSLLNPYRLPIEGTYLCSSSTPPGGGAHGMCGYHAARAALEDAS